MAGPPGALIARLMQGIVVAVAQRHGELARLEPGAKRSECDLLVPAAIPKAKSGWPAPLP